MTRRRKKKKRRTKIFSSFPKEHRMTQLTHASTKRYARSKDGSLCCYRTVSLCFILSLSLSLSMCRRYAREGKTDRAFCILFIAPPEPALRRLWNSATVVSSPSRTTCQRRDTNQYIRMVTKNRDLLQKRRHKLHKRRASPRPLVRRKSRSKNTTPGPRGLVPNSSPRTSSDVVSGSPPLPKPTEVPPKYLLAMRALKTLSKRPIERFNASPSPRARPRRKASR